MDELIFRALQEWARLESAYHKVRSGSEAEAAKTLAALSEKGKEILRMRAQTKEGAFLHLRSARPSWSEPPARQRVLPQRRYVTPQTFSVRRKCR